MRISAQKTISDSPRHKSVYFLRIPSLAGYKWLGKARLNPDLHELQVVAVALLLICGHEFLKFSQAPRTAFHVCVRGATALQKKLS